MSMEYETPRDEPSHVLFRPSPIALDIGLLIARLPLGVLFTFAGAMKLKGGIGNFVAQASGAIPPFLPAAIGKAYLRAVPVAELVVGLMLIFGVLTRVTGLVASLMLVSFIIAATGVKSAEGGPFHTNVVYLAIALLLMFASGGRISVDGLLLDDRKPAA